jgi:hypothetical protein
MLSASVSAAMPAYHASAGLGSIPPSITGGAYPFLRDACKDWNTHSCSRGASCRYKHQCSWPQCAGSDRMHPALACPSKPAGWMPAAARTGSSSVVSSRGGRGGARGGRGAAAPAPAASALGEKQ